MTQFVIDRFLDNITLHDLVSTEKVSSGLFYELLHASVPVK